MKIVDDTQAAFSERKALMQEMLAKRNVLAKANMEFSSAERGYIEAWNAIRRFDEAAGKVDV